MHLVHSFETMQIAIWWAEFRFLKVKGLNLCKQKQSIL